MAKSKEDWYKIGRDLVAAGIDEAVAEGYDLFEQINGMGQDLLKEMSELDPADENYENHMEMYRGMLSRLD